jgi:hypothetical protein
MGIVTHKSVLGSSETHRSVPSGLVIPSRQTSVIFAPLFKLLIWIVRVVITLARVVLEGLETLLHMSKPKGKGH